MTRNRQLFHLTVLFLLPVLVAAMDFTVAAASALVLLMLLWRWLIVLSGIRLPEATADLELHSITASHFVEKVRWCMDRLELDYVERQHAGTLGVFFTGRTVPQLRVRTGVVQSTIGNSPEILRFLWGSYADLLGDRADFLRPDPDRREFEQNLDRYGRNLQVWVYFHLLKSPQLLLRAWGAASPDVPAWQRILLRPALPLLRVLIRLAFSVNRGSYEKATSRIDELLSGIETRLSDGRTSILGGDKINYTDIAFAAMSSLWLQPSEFASGKAASCRLEREEMPAPMRRDVERWLEDYPRAAGFVTRLYATERRALNRSGGAES